MTNIRIHQALIEAKHGANCEVVVDDGSDPNLNHADIIKALMKELSFTPNEDQNEFEDDDYAEIANGRLDLDNIVFDFGSVKAGYEVHGSFEGSYATFIYQGCSEPKVISTRAK